MDHLTTFQRYNSRPQHQSIGRRRHLLRSRQGFIIGVGVLGTMIRNGESIKQLRSLFHRVSNCDEPKIRLPRIPHPHFIASIVLRGPGNKGTV